VLLAVDEVDRQTDPALSHPLMPTSTAAAAAAAGSGDGDDVGHYSYRSHHRDADNTRSAAVTSWTSAQVTQWLECSRLQHLADWYVLVLASHLTHSAT